MSDTKLKFSRRSLLLWVGTLGLVSLGGLRFFLGGKAGPVRASRFLSYSQANILASIYQVMTGVSAQEQNEIERAVAFMDRFLSNLNDRDLFEFKLGLWAWQHSPLLFHGFFRPFTGLSRQDQRLCLEGHQQGAPWRVPLYSGLKALCFMAYYANEKQFVAIGYEGPWVAEDQRDLEFSREYLALKAPL